MRGERGIRPLPGASLAACALLAGLVLAIWGCASTAPPSGNTGKPRPQVWRPAAPDANGPVVGVVGSHRITRHEVDSLISSAPQAIRERYLSSPDEYRQLIERITEQEALYQAAVQAGTESDSAYRADVAIYSRQLLVKRYYENASRSLPAIPDSLLRLYYEEHAADFKVPGRARVRHILLPTRGKAGQVLKRLKAGGSWDPLCARYSTDTVSGKSGGIIGYVVPDVDLVPGIGKAPEIVAAAFRLKEGETSEPLKSERGWHIIRVDQAKPAGVHKFEDVRKQIRVILEGDRNEAFQTTLIDSLKKRFGVTVFEDSLDLALKPSQSPADLFQAAQAAGTAQQRIELFRTVVARYPEDKAAAQAQFMIGFTYAEELSDFPAAREAFGEFLKRYPDANLVESARWMLENMESSALPPGIGAPGDSLDLIFTPANPPEGTGTTR